MKILLAYPGLMPPAVQAVRAFHEANILHSFATTFVYQPHQPLQRWLAKILPKRFEAELERRIFTALPPEFVRTYPWRELKRVFLARVGVDERVNDAAWEEMVLHFDRRVAQSLSKEVSAVYGYEHACRATFERAAQLGARRIFDLAAPHFSYFQKVVEAEREANPSSFPDDWNHIHEQDARRNQRKKEEYDLTDLVIANSKFTAQTLTDTGYPASKVRVVPLGGPLPVDRLSVRDPKRIPLFLFVGSVSVRKGFPHLLRAWQKLGANVPAELVVAGKWDLASALRAKLPPTVKLLDNVPYAQVQAWLDRASLLILPSLCDGFGMVVTEAMARGVPVLTTNKTGAADLVQEGSNGWVVPAASSDALADKIQWCLDHPEELEVMRGHALRTAKENTWTHFRGRLAKTITDLFSAI